MRKTELTNPALYKAVAEMADGLIDADLGGDVLKNGLPCPEEEKVAGFAPWSLPDEVHVGSSCSVSKKVIAQTSRMSNWRDYKH